MSNAYAIMRPAPLVGWRHPLKWLLQVTALILAGIVGAHVGKFIIVALYYLVIEGAGAHHWPITTGWHNLIGSKGLIGNDDTRHLIRDVGEGLLGGTLGQMLAWNAYKSSVVKKVQHAPLTRLDRIEFKLRIPNIKDPRRIAGWQVPLAPFYVILYAIPGFALAYGITDLIHHINPAHIAAAHPHAMPYVDKVKSIWTGSWDKVLVGLFASWFLGKRPVAKFANDVQLWFVERRVFSGKRPRFYDTPAFKARMTDVRTRMVRGEDQRSAISHTGLVAGAMLLSLFACVCLTGYGYYVVTEIATKAH